MLLPIHVAAGGFAIVLGAIALIVKKGGTIHRRSGSFFSIRERVTRVLPQPFTTGPMRALPILLLFGAMFCWLWRVRRTPAANA